MAEVLVVEGLRAYRDALARRIETDLGGRLESVPGGEWDGMDVLRRAELEAGIRSVFDHSPEASSTFAEVQTPAAVRVLAVCPRCALPTPIRIDVSAELRTTEDGSEMHVKTKTKAADHTCGQLGMLDGEETEDGPNLADLIGPTEEVPVFDHEAALPDDELAEEGEDACGAEASDPDRDDPVEEGGETQRVWVCHRRIDHEGPHFSTSWGAASWHYATRPIPTGLEGADEGGPDTPATPELVADLLLSILAAELLDAIPGVGSDGYRPALLDWSSGWSQETRDEVARWAAEHVYKAITDDEPERPRILDVLFDDGDENTEGAKE